MKIIVLFNAAFSSTMVVAALGIGVVAATLLEHDATSVLEEEARLMLDSAAATREYTAAEIVPLLDAHVKGEFLPQSVPFYATTQNFLRLRRQHPEYSYKEATLNPTNPRDRAMDWEADLIQKFRDDPALHELLGERDSPTGRSLYLARPIRVSTECLECHSVADTAPKALVASYGSNNGFGWQANEVVGSQVVSVPVSRATHAAHRTWIELMIAVAAIEAGLLLVLNVLLYGIVIKPLQRVATLADEFSKGGGTGAHFPERGATEITALSRAFDRMRISLDKAMKLLGS